MRALRFLVLGLAAWACLGCRAPDFDSEPWAGPAPAPKTLPPYVRPAGFDRLRVGLTPFLDPTHLQAAFAPLAAYLSESLGVPVDVEVAPSYDDLGQRMGRGGLDLGFFTAYGYVRATADDPSLRPLVSVIADGSATAGGYLVVRESSPFQRLEDLRGKRLALVDPASTSGYLFPMVLLRERGIDPATYFSKVAFLGNHEAALMAVQEGEFDATATYQGAFRSLQASQGVHPREFRVIAKTPRTPRDVFCARADLPTAVTDELNRVLVSLSSRTSGGRAILDPLQINGFFPADDRLFEGVRSADRSLDAGHR